LPSEETHCSHWHDERSHSEDKEQSEKNFTQRNREITSEG
jgi:hypothetical protein